MREYFEAEMRLLKEAAQEFAEQYPEQARMLNLQALPDRDPYVERLLEGVAFLTSQIRQKIDDDIPEISGSLLMQIWPHLLRPFPSVTIVQFVARAGQLQQTHTIAPETMLQSQAVGKEHQVCKFRTTTKVKLNPLKISNISVDPINSGTIIKLDFKAETMMNQLDLTNLRLFLHTDQGIALELHYALTHQIQKCVVLDKNVNIQPCLPDVESKFFGFHLLQEYFLCREKYSFLEIQGLEKIIWPEHCQQFTLKIHSKHLFPNEYQIKKDMFQLHCVPAVNGSYPSQHLQENQINVPAANFPKHIQFNNITIPTPMHMPPNKTDYRWTLISHLALNYDPLTDIQTLRCLLQNYDWSNREENKKRIVGIDTIDMESVNQIHKGALVQGIKVNLKMNEKKLSSHADIHLFGQVLHHFFSMYANINNLVITHIVCHPSGKEFVWKIL